MELIIDIYYEFNIILLSGEREKAKNLILELIINI